MAILTVPILDIAPYWGGTAARKREMAQQVGFVLLMLLMVYALYNDLVRIDAFKFFR